MKIKNIFRHLGVICTHKYYVAKYCFKFGLYRQGLVHDFSKFNPKEFWTSVKYYQGNRSPIEAEKEDKGYSMAWLHHFHNNPHHWGYWVDFNMEQTLTPYKMPYKYVIESICDSIAAGITYSKKSGTKYNFKMPYQYYKDHIRINNVVSKKIFHPNTRLLFDTIYVDIMNKGINNVISLHKSKYYSDMYRLLETSNAPLIIDSYKQLVENYYTSNFELEERFDNNIGNIINVINSFNSTKIKKLVVSVKFYTYLHNSEYLDYNNELLCDTFYDVPIEIVDEKLKADYSYKDYDIIFEER